MDSGIHLVGKPGGIDRFSTSNPATGEEIAEHPIASAEDVSAAVARARQAQLWWSQLPVRKRSAVTGTLVGVRLQAGQIKEIDAWAAKQVPPVTRPEAIRGMIDALLSEVAR